MIKNSNDKKEFKREYIPVIVTGVILIILVIALVFMIFFKGNLDLEKVPDNSGHEVNELITDVDKNKCSSDLIKKLSSEAKKVKMEYKESYREKNNSELYEEQDSGENFYTYDYFWNVIFNNMTDNFYLKITNDKNDNVKTITKDTLVDGKWQFDTEIDDDVVVYTISLISNVDGCNEQVFRKFELKALIFNVWSTSSMCSSYKNFELCKRWITEDTVPLETFMARLNKYKKEHPEIAKTNIYGVPEPTTTQKNQNSNNQSNTTSENKTTKVNKNEKENKNSDKKNIIYISIGAVILVLIGVVIVILLKKRGSK